MDCRAAGNGHDPSDVIPGPFGPFIVIVMPHSRRAIHWFAPRKFTPAREPGSQ